MKYYKEIDEIMHFDGNEKTTSPLHGNFFSSTDTGQCVGDHCRERTNFPDMLFKTTQMRGAGKLRNGVYSSYME
ncbi:MAG: hypothetical protein PHQ23_09275 [Candidatus Wallbacteria bacterium]|nr:hypothetical protein [Candidatus Wallbacteria bacterium]